MPWQLKSKRNLQLLCVLCATQTLAVPLLPNRGKFKESSFPLRSERNSLFGDSDPGASSGLSRTPQGPFTQLLLLVWCLWSHCHCPIHFLCTVFQLNSVPTK